MLSFHWCFALLITAEKKENTSSTFTWEIHCTINVNTCSYKLLYISNFQGHVWCVCALLSTIASFFHQQYTHHVCHPGPLCWWIIDDGSTVRIRDTAVIDERFMLPFILYIYVVRISMPVCCIQRQWHSVNVLCIFNVHIYPFPNCSPFSSPSIFPHPQNTNRDKKILVLWLVCYLNIAVVRYWTL